MTVLNLSHRRCTLDGLRESIRVQALDVLSIDSRLKNWADPYVPTGLVEADLLDAKKALKGLLDRYFVLEKEEGQPPFLPLRRLNREIFGN